MNKNEENANDRLDIEVHADRAEKEATSDASNDGAETKNNKKDTEKKKDGEKKLRGRKRLFADYQYREVKSKNGKTKRRKVYTGKHYGYVIPSAYKKNEKGFLNRIKLFYFGILAVLVLLWLVPLTVLEAQGFGGYGNKDMNFFYVFMPHMVTALPLMLMTMTLVEFVCTRGNRHELAFAEALTKNLRGQTITAMICSGVCAISETIFIILNHNKIASLGRELSIIAIMAGIIVVCIFWLKLQDSLRMEDKK